MPRPSEHALSLDGTPSLGDPVLYLLCSGLVAGNVVLPLLVHRIPMGGPALMPILFFTLIAGWEFGFPAALLTAFLSPLASHALTGMPPAPALGGVILNSLALGAVAAAFSRGGRRGNVLFLALAVLVHQGLMTAAGCLAAGPGPALQALGTRIPGILLQILGGWAGIRLLGASWRRERP